MVIKKGDHISDIPLSEVGAKVRLVPIDHPLIERALGLDICMGIKK
jgi:hypothetical protein